MIIEKTGEPTVNLRMRKMFKTLLGKDSRGRGKVHGYSSSVGVRVYQIIQSNASIFVDLGAFLNLYHGPWYLRSSSLLHC